MLEAGRARSCLEQGWVGVNAELWKMEYYYCPRLLKFLQYLWVSVLWNVSVLPELAVSTLFRKPGSALIGEGFPQQFLFE